MDISGELVIIGVDEEDDAPPGVAEPGPPVYAGLAKAVLGV